VLRLVTINDLDIQLDRVINTYYSSGLKLQPIIIVVGPFDCEINELFLYFDGNLISCASFVNCLELGFKTFQILSFEYPKASQQAWLFIQQYFYDIYTKYDSKSANIANLIDFFDVQTLF